MSIKALNHIIIVTESENPPQAVQSILIFHRTHFAPNASKWEQFDMAVVVRDPMRNPHDNVYWTRRMYDRQQLNLRQRQEMMTTHLSIF